MTALASDPRGRPVPAATRVARTMTEAQLQASVLELCRDLGLYAYHTYDSRRCEPGWPDLVIVGAGGILFRELKDQRNMPTPEQRHVGRLLLAAGASWAIWRPGDLVTGQILDQLSAVRYAAAER